MSPIITAILVIVSSATYVVIERPAILAGRRHYEAFIRWRNQTNGR